MIPTSELMAKARVNPDALSALSERRRDLRRVYSSPEGRRLLADIIRSGHIFTQTDPEDADASSKRNYALSMLEDAGLIDEASIDMIAGYMLTLPVLPEAVADAIEGEGNGR